MDGPQIVDRACILLGAHLQFECCSGLAARWRVIVDGNEKEDGGLGGLSMYSVNSNIRRTFFPLKGGGFCRPWGGIRLWAVGTCWCPYVILCTQPGTG